jgi:hypothetical protein
VDPAGKVMGGFNHWNYCAEYQVLSNDTFQVQVQKLAKLDLSKLPEN